jgi:hypothetical protein
VTQRLRFTRRFREHGFRPKMQVKRLANPADADFELGW